MVDRTLTLQSYPTGIEIKVQYSNQAMWKVTNTTVVVPDGTVITLIAPSVVGEPRGTTEKGWYFKQWKSNGTVLGNDRALNITMDADKTAKAYYEQQLYYPTRDPDKRSTKFEGKADEEVIKLRTTALKDMMVSQQHDTATRQTLIENRVAEVLASEGLYGLELHHYRNFSQELFGLTRLFRGLTLNKESSLKAQKWKGRGLTEARLQKVANIFNITLTFT